MNSNLDLQPNTTINTTDTANTNTPTSPKTAGTTYLIKLEVSNSGTHQFNHVPQEGHRPCEKGITAYGNGESAIVFYISERNEMVKLPLDSRRAARTNFNGRNPLLDGDQLYLRHNYPGPNYLLRRRKINDYNQEETIAENAFLPPVVTANKFAWASKTADSPNLTIYCRKKDLSDSETQVDTTLTDLASNSQSIAYIRKTDGQNELVITQIEATVGTPSSLATGVVEKAPVMDENFVYYLTSKDDGQQFNRISTSSKAIETTTRSYQVQGRIALSNTALYFVHATDQGPQLIKLDKNNLNTETIIQPQHDVTTWVGEPVVTQSNSTTDTIWIVGTEDIFGDEG